MLTNKLTGAGAADKTYIEDVFSTYLYTGNGSTQTITNGIDLAGKGGMVWIKNRAAGDNIVVDTANSASSSDLFLITNATGSYSYGQNYVDYSNSGFSLETSATGFNVSGSNYASWTFRKAPKFFDVVTYTGNGVAGRTISHSLGQAPGMIFIKRLDSAKEWLVYHRSIGATYTLFLNLTNSKDGPAIDYWNNTEPTSSVFTLGNYSGVNDSSGTYVAYLFAHDTTTDGLIQCGSFTTDASGNASVNLGREPQYVLVKSASATDDWRIYDVMRGMVVGNNDALLRANSSGAELTQEFPIVDPTATGFNWSFNGVAGNTTYIYMAIRRGPMRTPTDGTKVFKPLTYSGDDGVNRVITGVGFAGDLMIGANRSGMVGQTYDRLRGKAIQLRTVGTDAEVNRGGSEGYMGMSDFTVDWNQGVLNTSGYNYASWIFKRAPGFFDVVCYTGTGVARTVNHNLGVAPELIIVKGRSAPTQWSVYAQPLGNTGGLVLNSNAGNAGPVTWWNSTSPTSTTFGTGNAINFGGDTYVAYLFASCPGVSKVGSYTGNGTSQTINCGFTNGARFVLIKRTDSTGDWYVWDTARGIVSSNDPHLSLNTTAAEVTTDDTIDPDSTGFIVNQVAATNVNVSAATYIYLAIA